MEIGGGGSIICLLVWPINFSKKTKRLIWLFRDKAHIYIGVGAGLGLVSKVVFAAFFEVLYLKTMEPHAGGTTNSPISNLNPR